MSLTSAIELDLDPQPEPRQRRPKWPLAGLALLAIVAVLIGHAQRPAPPNLGTVVRASGLSICHPGNDTAFEIDVVNQLATPITVSQVAIDVIGAPGLRVALGSEGASGPCRSGWSWSSAPGRLTLAPNELGAVFVGFPTVCRPDPGPIFKSVLLDH